MKNLMMRTVWMVQVFLLVALCGQTAWAQQQVLPPEAPTPGAVERTLQAPPAPEPPTLPEIAVEEDDRGVLTGGEGVMFELRDVTFSGNRVFSSEQLRELVAHKIGATIEVSELTRLADIISAFYREKGYFLSRAYIPPQTIKEGVVLIGIREGRLGEVIITGNQRYSRELIINTLKIIRGEGAVRTADVERALLLLMDMPGLSVSATFKPGDRPGTSDIVLHVTEDRAIKGGLDYNNFGSRYASRDRFGINMGVNNPFGRGDDLNLRLVTGAYGLDQLLYGRVEYSIPLGYSGLRLGMNAHAMNYELVRELGVIDAEGNSEGVGVWLSYPIIRSRLLNWYIDTGFDLRNVSQDIMNQELGKDKLRTASLGTTVQWIDSFQGSNTIRVSGRTGLASMFDGMKTDYLNLLRPAASVTYNLVEFQAYRVQQLPHGFVGLVNVAGQYTGNRLPSSEMLSIGGAGTVRGYAQGELSGDSGAYANAELRIPILGLTDRTWFRSNKTIGETLQLAAFYDYGAIRINGPLPGEKTFDKYRISGAGAGLRFAWTPHVQFKVDWAKNVDGRNPLRDHDNKNGVWYFQGVINF